jgi:hypothetical protein
MPTLRILRLYEPRAQNRYVINPRRIGGSVTLSSNYNNKFALDISPNFSIFDQEGRNAYGFILHLDIALMTN